MENSFQTSFIPKKTTQTSLAVVKEPKGFLFILSVIIFIITLVVAGGAFAYKKYLSNQESTLSTSLSKTRGGFEKSTIDELELFNKRTEVASLLLKNHATPSVIFGMLGEVTIPSVQYTSFNFQSNNGGYSVSLKGLAKDYRSIALQSDAFNTSKGKSFKNVLFSDLVKDKNNNVSFNLKFDIDPGLLSFEKNLTKKEESKNDTQVNTIPEQQQKNDVLPELGDPKKLQ